MGAFALGTEPFLVQAALEIRVGNALILVAGDAVIAIHKNFLFGFGMDL